MINTPHHIVAIGASAGGLEALQNLFDHIPGDTGAAFVVIQHLSPDFDSMMDQLLGKHSSMPAIIANNDMQILPNQIYLLAPKKSMTIQEGGLILTDRKSEADRLDLPINDFLRSLAMDRQNRSVAIILSGTGSDGCLGIKSVHEVGGLVMVQDPEESQFDGMPRNAISAGVVDMTAPVADLAEQLVSFFHRPLVAVNRTEFREHLAQNQNTLQNIFDLLQQQTASVFRLLTQYHSPASGTPHEYQWCVRASGISGSAALGRGPEGDRCVKARSADYCDRVLL